MKICSRCNVPKDIEEFHVSPREKDGRGPACKSCKKEIDAISHQKHRVRRNLKRKEDRRYAKEWFDSLKEGRPCSDCKIVHPPWRTDFDHLPGHTKLFNIADKCKLVTGPKAKKEILEEIVKCELVCANCHRDRTHNRRQQAQEVGI